MEVLNKDAPIICAECQKVKTCGNHLFCEEKQKLIYNSKPKWCPFPTWVEKSEQISLFAD